MWHKLLMFALIIVRANMLQLSLEKEKLYDFHLPLQRQDKVEEGNSLLKDTLNCYIKSEDESVKAV